MDRTDYVGSDSEGETNVSDGKHSVENSRDTNIDDKSVTLLKDYEVEVVGDDQYAIEMFGDDDKSANEENSDGVSVS